jgi:hypothetical protein
VVTKSHYNDYQYALRYCEWWNIGGCKSGHFARPGGGCFPALCAISIMPIFSVKHYTKYTTTIAITVTTQPRSSLVYGYLYRRLDILRYQIMSVHKIRPSFEPVLSSTPIYKWHRVRTSGNPEYTTRGPDIKNETRFELTLTVLKSGLYSIYCREAFP